jgi:hypothetical protein
MLKLIAMHYTDLLESSSFYTRLLDKRSFESRFKGTYKRVKRVIYHNAMDSP